MKTDILILNYNGKDLMKRFLPSIVEAAGNSRHDCTVHVVDNLSDDGSVGMLRQEFPEVVISVARENRVLCSYNEAVEGLESDTVIFLNNDMKVAPDFIDKLLRHFEDDSVMFVAPRIVNMDGTYNGGRSNIFFEHGAIKVLVDAEKGEEPGMTQAISCGAFRRAAFLRLGGFDDLYLPGIWEDVDICYRGLSLGWKGVYEPESVIWHDESTTFHREYGRRRKMRIAHRNMFLFFWKNITDKGMFAAHAALTLPRVTAQYITGNREPLEGFLAAIPSIPLVVKKRRSAAGEKRVLRDRDLIEWR